eukprot:15343175-Alexandrium_andersonii.AAC.1
MAEVTLAISTPRLRAVLAADKAARHRSLALAAAKAARERNLHELYRIQAMLKPYKPRKMQCLILASGQPATSFKEVAEDWQSHLRKIHCGTDATFRDLAVQATRQASMEEDGIPLQWGP